MKLKFKDAEIMNRPFMFNLFLSKLWLFFRKVWTIGYTELTIIPRVTYLRHLVLVGLSAF